MTLRSFKLIIATISIATILGDGAHARAQVDSTAPALRANPADTVRPPITPKRAFLLSLAAPGASQNILGRNRAGAGLIAVEAVSIAMIRESAADLHEARRLLGDSLVLSYVGADGVRLSQPVRERRRFAAEEVNSRRSHVEDWIALLIANHLFAAADAFVAASLWDVQAHIAVRPDRGRLMLVGRIAW